MYVRSNHNVVCLIIIRLSQRTELMCNKCLVKFMPELSKEHNRVVNGPASTSSNRPEPENTSSNPKIDLNPKSGPKIKLDIKNVYVADKLLRNNNRCVIIRACERGIQGVHRTRARNSSGFCVKFWYSTITSYSNLPTAKISVILFSAGNWSLFCYTSFRASNSGPLD